MRRGKPTADQRIAQLRCQQKQRECKRQTLPATLWRLGVRMRSDGHIQVDEQLEDTPFYQRALLHSELLGEQVQSFHESITMSRLVSPVVQAMLPWRMPRRA